MHLKASILTCKISIKKASNNCSSFPNLPCHSDLGGQRLFRHVRTTFSQICILRLNNIAILQWHFTYSSVIIARSTSQQPQHLCIKTNRSCLIVLLLSVRLECAMEQCGRACANSATTGGWFLCGLKHQLRELWLTAPHPQQRAFHRVCIYEDCPLQMLFRPLPLWYILCWLFELTCCHLWESDDTLSCVITLCEWAKTELSYDFSSPRSRRSQLSKFQRLCETSLFSCWASTTAYWIITLSLLL